MKTQLEYKFGTSEDSSIKITIDGNPRLCDDVIEHTREFMKSLGHYREV